jgi:transposase
MTENYQSLVEKNCPNASILIDRFPGTKMVQEEPNRARIAQK